MIALLSVVYLAGAATTTASAGLVFAHGRISMSKPINSMLAGLDAIEGLLLMLVTVLRCTIPLEEDLVVLNW